MKQMNKKGAIEITATAIVVFIIAIVVLGAVIYFIQDFFPEVFSIVKGEVAKIKQTLRAQLNSGEKIVFNFGDEVNMKSGGEEKFYIGIKNDDKNPDTTADSICFRVALYCVKPLNAPNDLECKKTLVGGVAQDGALPPTKWFSGENLFNEWEVKNKDMDVQGPVSLQPRVTSDTYLMEAKVYKEANNADCTSPTFAPTPYRSKQFRLILG